MQSSNHLRREDRTEVRERLKRLQRAFVWTRMRYARGLRRKDVTAQSTALSFMRSKRFWWVFGRVSWHETSDGRMIRTVDGGWRFLPRSLLTILLAGSPSHFVPRVKVHRRSPKSTETASRVNSRSSTICEQERHQRKFILRSQCKWEMNWRTRRALKS